MRFNFKLKLFVVGVAVLLFNSMAFAQTEQEAIEAFNDGASLSNMQDYVGAIQAFQDCIDIFGQLEITENEQLSKAKELIPSLQYKHARAVYKTGDIDKAMVEFEKLGEYSKEYENEKYAKSAKSTIPKLYYAKGKKQLDAKEYDAALTNLNKAVELNPNYGTAHIRLAMLHQEQGNEAEFEASIQNALNNKSDKTKANANTLAKKYYSKKGAEALQNKDYATAEGAYVKLLDYMSDNADIYYQLADIYVNLAKYDEAIETANKGVALFTEETLKDAKHHFVIATAYEKKGDKAAACAAYKKAKKGDYTEQAEYQIKHVLKCE